MEGVLELGEVRDGEFATPSITVANEGDGGLVVSAITVTGSDDLTVAADLPAHLAPEDSVTVVVTFAPTTPAPLDASLTVVTNDSNYPDGLEVPVEANHDLPCISLQPAALDFGVVQPGQVAYLDVAVTSCGDAPLLVSGMSLEPSSSAAFTLDPFGPGNQLPGTLAPGTTAFFLVRYEPVDAAENPGDVESVLDAATVRIEHDGYWHEVEVPIAGAAASNPSDTSVDRWAAIDVQLVWHTPGDADELDRGDGAGTDLDLHLAHAFATGEDVDEDGKLDGWFDLPFDCFWFNEEPNWGALELSIDDPRLYLTDKDGAGPEGIDLVLPEHAHPYLVEGLHYRVGVHYWQDHGYGPSLATVRVFVFGSLAFEATDVELQWRDMWEVATIHWPSGEVVPISGSDGGPKILSDYENPFFPIPDPGR